MKIFPKTVRTVKRAFAVDELKSSTKLLKDMAQETYDKTRTASDGAGKKRKLDWSDTEKEQARSYYTKMFFLYVIVFAIDIIWLLINIFHGQWIVSVLCVAFGVMCMALIFKQHYWLTQIRVGAVGLSLKEWFSTLRSKSTR